MRPPAYVPPQPPVATTSRYAQPIPQHVQPNSHVHHPTILQQQNMGEPKAYNITAAPQQTPHNPRSQEQAKYNKRTVANRNRVSYGKKSMNQHHKINPQSELRNVDIKKTSEQIFAQPEIQSNLENDMDDAETRNKMGTKQMGINNITAELNQNQNEVITRHPTTQHIEEKIGSVDKMAQKQKNHFLELPMRPTKPPEEEIYEEEIRL